MPDLPFYKPHQLLELQAGYCTVNPAYERLMFDYLSLRLTNEAAQEYARHGFLRRLGTLKRSIENVYSTYPPERPSSRESWRRNILASGFAPRSPITLGASLSPYQQ